MSQITMKMYNVVLVLTFLAISAVNAFATPAINFTSPSMSPFSNVTQLVGWQFTVNNNITVDTLGFYNDPTAPMTSSHQVGIFNDITQALVVSGVVSPTDMYSNFFNWSSVPTTVLTAGQTYDIVALVGTDNRTWNPNGLTVDPSITYDKSVYTDFTNTLSFPISTDPLIGHFGPNFDIASTPVPEPGTIMLLGIGMAGLAVYGKRRQNNA